MKTRLPVILVFAIAATVIAQISHGQRDRFFRQRSRQRDRISDHGRRGVPNWKVDDQFAEDVFTFVRVQYGSYGRRWKWRTDYPDSDLNFSFRLQQLTSMKVDPNGKVLRLTDKELFNYPFLYIVEPGDLYFEEDEIVALRRYLLNGGFLMVDDFWGTYEWENFYQEIKRVFPNREPKEVPLGHPIFHCVYDL